MVYIFNKIIRGRSNYYLRISKREKSRVISKDIAYLGKDINEVREKINNLSKYKNEIRKSYKNLNKFIEKEYYLKKVRVLKLRKNKYLSKELQEEVEAINIHYKKFLKKDEKTKNQVYEEFIIDFVFNTNSIEGNTIKLSEAERLLKENIMPKNKTLREVNDMLNSENTFKRMINSTKKLKQELIIKTHSELMKDIDTRTGYRAYDIKIRNSKFKSTPFPYIKTDMGLLIDFYEKNKKLHPLILAVLFHHKFEKIHPFSDGNGRTGRMVMNYILIQNSYPPIIIRKKTRGEYLDSLKKADISGLTEKNSEHYKKLMKYIVLELLDCYWNNFLI